jgi:hypothetical protein
MRADEPVKAIKSFGFGDSSNQGSVVTGCGLLRAERFVFFRLKPSSTLMLF